MTKSALYQYVVVIKNENTRYINLIGIFLSVGSAGLFLREMLISGRMNIAYLMGVLFIAGLLIWNWFRARNPENNIYYSKALLIAGLVWTRMPYFEWLFFVFMVLALLEYQAKLPLEIGFSTSGIVFNTLIKRNYTWPEISNVIINNGLLTIDFQNNTLFQKEIDEGEREAGDEEFNHWCEQQLKGRFPGSA